MHNFNTAFDFVMNETYDILLYSCLYFKFNVLSRQK